MSPLNEYKDTVLTITQWLADNYWDPLDRAVKSNPDLLNTFPGFLLKPDKLIYYFGRHHIGIEYMGPERISAIPERGNLKVQFFDYSQNDSNLLEQIIGFDYGKGLVSLPLPPMTEHLVLPTNAGADVLTKLGWNWKTQDFILGFNVPCFSAPKGQFTRLMNSRFFDATSDGSLKTRHIKWLDLVPCKYDDTGEVTDSWSISLGIFQKLAEVDIEATYPIPTDFQLRRLDKMNRFIELIGDKDSSETAITRFLANDDLRFAIKARFAAKEIFPECQCEWQSVDRKPIRPDFFVVGPDGYADIVEFKLPDLHGSPVVGTENRETFSAAINSYVSQTRVYREYFEDPNNRAYVETTYGFKVHKPKRHLVIGRRWHFSNHDWRSIAADFTDLTIHSYDDFIDGIVVQLYD